MPNHFCSGKTSRYTKAHFTLQENSVTSGVDTARFNHVKGLSYYFKSSLVEIWKTSNDVDATSWFCHRTVCQHWLKSKGQMSLPTVHISPLWPPTFASPALQVAVAPVPSRHHLSSAPCWWFTTPFSSSARQKLWLCFCFIISVYIYSWKLELLGWTQS